MANMNSMESAHLKQDSDVS